MSRVALLAVVLALVAGGGSRPTSKNGSGGSTPRRSPPGVAPPPRPGAHPRRLHHVAAHRPGGLAPPGSPVWAASFASPATSHWQNQPPELLPAGSDIISNTDGLSRHFAPLLR